MAKPLYVLLNNNNPDLILWESWTTDFKALKESLINPPALGNPNYQIIFFLFIYEKEGDALGILTQKHGDYRRPTGFYSQQLDPVAWGYPIALEPL